MKMLLSNI